MFLILKNIIKSYPDGTEKQRFVLNGLDLTLEKGSITAITGPSGSGKSTLLNIIGKMDEPTSGDIIYKGKNITLFSDSEILKYRNKEIGFVFQLHYLLPQLNILENILIPTIPFKSDKKESLNKAEELLND